jgi:hypothetical protein
VDFTFAQEKGRRVRHLKEIRLSQVGMVMFPMNPDAQIMQVKHDFTALLETLTDEQKAELRALLGPAFPDPDQKAPPPVELATPAQMATLKAKLGQLHFGDHAYTARLASIGATDHGQPDSGDRRQA